MTTGTDSTTGRVVLRIAQRLALAISMVVVMILGVPSIASAADECDPSQFQTENGFEITAYELCKNPENTTPNVTPGGTVVIQGGGYAPFSEVDVVLCVDGCDPPPNLVDDIFLGTVIADRFGNFTWEGNLPAGIEEGDYVIEVEGVDRDGNALVLSYDVEVVQPEDNDGNLPYTGSRSLRLTAIGAGLFVLGGVAVASTKRLKKATR